MMMSSLIEQYAGESLQRGPEVQRREIYIGEEHDAQRRTLADGDDMLLLCLQKQTFATVKCS
jgi:hypothetical protein